MATVNITSKVNELMCWGPAPLHPAVYCYAIHTPIPLPHLGPGHDQLITSLAPERPPMTVSGLGTV